ncbi:hypothetical protein [Vibrio parahaemolyticus]|uniref:hypothetical protein n=1 Tax=Vibrio parahaemolyticus TaxID=670 RepID=UPI00215D2C6A|nr:hypothetical protein [Vibrio parahaemolyticus]MCR9819745.1 hypothetical protein [Vibrio parahaemolyticus]
MNSLVHGKNIPQTHPPVRFRGWVQLCSALMKVKEPYLLTGHCTYDSEVKNILFLFACTQKDKGRESDLSR